MEKSYKYIINPKSQPQPKLAIPKAPALPSVINDYIAGQKVFKGQSVIYNGIIYTAVVDTTATPSASSRDYKMVGAVDGIGIELNVTASDVKITDAEKLTFTAKISYYGADRTNSFAEFLTWTSDAGEVKWSKAVATLTPRKDLTAGVYEVVASLTPYGITHKVIISKNSEKKIEKERQDRESAIAAEGGMREKLEQDIVLYKQSNATDIATLTDLLNKANATIGDIQKQVDGEVSNWFYTGAPGATKLPESEWKDNATKLKHVGDTYTSTDKEGQYRGKSWRYTTQFTWQEIHDTLVSQALEMASRAQTTADGKSTTYLVKPTKYEEGDCWVLESAQTVNGIAYEKGTVLYATQNSSAFVQAHWVDKLKYISKSESEKNIKASEAKSKQAWEAYAKSQAEAERVKAEAYADGKIDEEEQARIDATAAALRTAKEYAEAQDALLKAQQEAYADGKVSEAERNAIDVASRRAELAEANAKAYADGIVDEEEQARIAAAQKAYDDAVAKAKEMDDNVQIGERNLILNSGQVIKNSEYRTANYFLSKDALSLKTGDEVTLVVKGKLAEGKYAWKLYNSGGMIEIPLKVEPSNFVDGVAYVTGKWREALSDPKYPGQNTALYFYAFYNSSVGESTIEWVKLVRGNKTSKDWTEAPEDVEARYQKLIASVDVEFALSASMTVAPTSGWVTTAPAPQVGKYMWQRTKTTLKDGAIDIKGVTCIAGADGRSIVSITEQYYHSTSMTALQGGSWSNTAPTPADEKWIWTRSVIKYTIGDDTITDAICVTGHKGKDAQGVRANLMPLDNFRYNSGAFHGSGNSYSNGKLTIAEANVCKNSLTSIAAFGSRDKQYIDGTTAGKTLIYSYYVRNNTNVPLIVGNHVYNDASRLTPVHPGQVSRRYMVRTDGYERFVIGESRINGDTTTLTGTVEYYDFKVEQAQDGEELVPTAYIPCVIDMQGTSGTSLIYYGTRSFVSTSSYITVGYGDANWLNNLNLPLSSIKAGDTLYLLVTLTDTGQRGVLYINVTSVGTTVAGKVVA